MSRTHRGGRSSGKWEKFQRKYSTRSERMNEREFVSRAKIDEDATLTYDVEEREPLWGKGWYGYWRPMRRWLRSRVGQPWNQVYSDLIAKLKQFTSTKDELSIRSYVTGMVEITPDPRFSWNRRNLNEGYSWVPYDFYVDDTGLLQERIHRSRKSERRPKYDTRDLAEWLNGRIVGYQGNQLYWFVPVAKTKKYGRAGYSEEWKCEWTSEYGYYSRYGLKYLYLDYEIIGDKDTKEVIERRPIWIAFHKNDILL